MKMQEISHFEQIEAYLDKSMTEEEISAFEQKLKNDQILKGELEMVRTIRLGIKYHGEQGLRDKIKQTHEQLNQSKFFHSQTKSITMALNQTVKWVVSAAAVVALALGYVYFFKQEKPMPEDEFIASYLKTDLSNFEKYADQLEAQGFAAGNTEDSIVGPIIIKATNYFSQGKYKEAEQELIPVVETYPDDAHARYYLGKAKLEQGKFEDAATVLAVFETNADSLYSNFEFHDDALFELSKCFYQNRNAEGYERAISIWKTIYQDPKHKEYLRNLERIKQTEIYRDEAKEKEKR